MIPFLHIGSLPIPTYGLMVAIGMLVAAYLLQFDISRHRAVFLEHGYFKDPDEKNQGDEAFLIIGIIGVSGLVAARLYSVLENPRELLANPAVLISQYGFTWSGAVLSTLVVMVLLARHFQIPVLKFMDLCAPPAALGYGIGRIGCLLSGDGDYGIPTSLPWGMSFPNGIVPTTERVHPTPIYEFLVAILIAWILWRLGARGLKTHAPKGIIFAAYLVLTGIARFLVEFIRINPRVFYGLTNAQVVSLLSIVAGVILLLRVRNRLPARKEENRIAGRAG